MQQRRPRLGDVLDDYCPRERRITNHVVVAMIEDQVKQTRCTTCDGDHDYKQARTPSPRKPKAVAAIQDGAEAFEATPVLGAQVRGSTDADAPVDATPMDDDSLSADEPMPASAPLGASGGADNAPLALAASSEPPPGDNADEEPLEPGRDDGPVHRRLIRATLPRPEGHVPERKEPEFTVRQQGGRGGGGGREVDGNSVGYRQKGGGHRPQGGFGQGGGGGHSRFGGQRHGSGQPPRQGQGGRPAPNGQRGGRPDARPDGLSNSRGQRGPGSGGRRRGGR
jgi:hypothetical protein